MTAASLGPGREFDRIRQILSRLGPLARGVGDDCAIVLDGPGRLVVSSDLSIEGRHFRQEWLTLEEIGARATAAALSDLAADGALAVGALVSLGVPPEASDTGVVTLMGGVGMALGSVNAVLLGGDLSGADQWIVDVTVLGRAERPVTRVGALPGDGVWVSGQLGGARAALAHWRAGREPDAASRAAFARPVPRIALGAALARAGARAMIDLSDGLGGDARHLAAASGVALEIALELVPRAPGAEAGAALEGVSAEMFAGRGGEDYELLATLPPEFGAEQARTLAEGTGVPLTRIGAVHAATGVRFLLEGREVSLAGFDHFR